MKLTKLYFDWASPPSRAVLTLSHMLGASPSRPHPRYQFHEVRLSKNEHLYEEFGRVNPARQVPAISESDGFNLSESHSIMRYLVETSQNERIQQLYQKDARARAKVDEFLDWNHSNLRWGTNRLVFMSYFTKIRGTNITSEQHQHHLSEAGKVCIKSLDHMADRLSKTSFVASNQLSLGDLAAICDIA